jgi:hypothetical protein
LLVHPEASDLLLHHPCPVTPSCSSSHYLALGPLQQVPTFQSKVCALSASCTLGSMPSITGSTDTLLEMPPCPPSTAEPCQENSLSGQCERRATGEPSKAPTLN